MKKTVNRVINVNGQEVKAKMSQITYNERLSDETECFSAVIRFTYPNRSHIEVSASNDGRGGETNIVMHGCSKDVNDVCFCLQEIKEAINKMEHTSFINYMIKMGYAKEASDLGKFQYLTIESLADDMLDEAIYSW